MSLIDYQLTEAEELQEEEELLIAVNELVGTVSESVKTEIENEVLQLKEQILYVIYRYFPIIQEYQNDPLLIQRDMERLGLFLLILMISIWFLGPSNRRRNNNNKRFGGGILSSLRRSRSIRSIGSDNNNNNNNNSSDGEASERILYDDEYYNNESSLSWDDEQQTTTGNHEKLFERNYFNNIAASSYSRLVLPPTCKLIRNYKPVKKETTPKSSNITSTPTRKSDNNNNNNINNNRNSTRTIDTQDDEEEEEEDDTNPAERLKNYFYQFCFFWRSILSFDYSAASHTLFNALQAGIYYYKRRKVAEVHNDNDNNEEDNDNEEDNNTVITTNSSSGNNGNNHNDDDENNKNDDNNEEKENSNDNNKKMNNDLYQALKKYNDLEITTDEQETATTATPDNDDKKSNLPQQDISKEHDDNPGGDHESTTENNELLIDVRKLKDNNSSSQQSSPIIGPLNAKLDAVISPLPETPTTDELSTNDNQQSLLNNNNNNNTENLPLMMQIIDHPDGEHGRSSSKFQKLLPFLLSKKKKPDVINNRASTVSSVYEDTIQPGDDEDLNNHNNDDNNNNNNIKEDQGRDNDDRESCDQEQEQKIITSQERTLKMSSFLSFESLNGVPSDDGDDVGADNDHHIIHSRPSDDDNHRGHFFDTASSRTSLQKLSVEIPVPDKHGYILGDEFLPDRKLYTPLLVFVNSRSGPQQGHLLITQLKRLLNPIQVWDLADGDPKPVLESFIVLSRLRILVCGGDGTVAWIINTLEQMNIRHNRKLPPIAILPLGTGNDLARILGWGGGYNNESLIQILKQVSESYTSLLDRWEVTIHDSKKNNNNKKKNKKQPIAQQTKEFFNYLGVGADAQAALQVHYLRERKPEWFFSRLVNKLMYGVFGAEDIIKASSVHVRKEIKLIADGVEIPLPPDSQGIILLNIDSYAGGVPLWSHGVNMNFPSITKKCFPKRSRSLSEFDETFDNNNNNKLLLPTQHSDLASSTFDRVDSVDDLYNLSLSAEERFAMVTACDRPSSCQDGYLDVVSIRGAFHLGQIKVGLGNAQRLCQCREVTIIIKNKVAVQVDGEPWRQRACTISVKRKKDPAVMLHRSVDDGGVEMEMSKLLDWAEERKMIDSQVHTILMKEFSRRIESLTRQRRAKSQQTINVMSTLKKAISSSALPGTSSNNNTSHHQYHNNNNTWQQYSNNNHRNYNNNNNSNVYYNTGYNTGGGGIAF